MKREKKQQTINRRKFVGNTVKIVTLGSLLMPLVEACGNKKSSEKGNTGTGTGKGKGTHSSKKSRKKWNHESLVVNTKTNVIHFPTAIVYTYYDEIKPNHLLDIPLVNKEYRFPEEVDQRARFNKNQSGNIYEILSLRYLSGGINEESIYNAYTTLAGAFTDQYASFNEKNFRLHELMLQLITLHTGIPAYERWLAFNQTTKRPETLRKRQLWMADEKNFTQRVNYILERKDDYIARLKKRAERYSFT